ncbi:nose resistant to fluoxetine protein 6-like [Episyrphus balteatus]|uniref:nose resistant to fluoxetine protein 6-like n=1 Tax=Episyrphus balteatus TaxID=286459 RepID=UPI00248575BB|nr:nose resistant to fluoxetine protein 6-like [Episyrphus balteatus]
MLKILLVFLIIFQSLLLQTQSKTVIENVTVSSDLIQDLFSNEIETNLKLAEIKNADDEKCILQLKKSVKSIQFLDSWGKFPSGILSGHVTDFGNYDQCVKISTILIPSHGVTNGKYCLASIPMPFKSKLLSEEETPASTDGIAIFGRNLLPTISLNIRLGICIPEICRPELVSNILQRATGKVLNGRLAGSAVSKCSVARKPDFKAIDIIAIGFCSVIAALMLLSSLYDLWTTHFQRKPLPLLLAFSVITNGRKLFNISSEKSPNSITCLTGIRVFSIFWVIHCHNFFIYASLNVINLSYVLTWANNFTSMPIIMGTLSVDSFFFLSGLLVAWLVLKELDRTRGKLNIGMMYLHRYIRLTPALAAVILFSITINKYIGSGPIRTPAEGCDKGWWLVLLYVQNYVKNSHLCIAQGWYLACDTQLYVLSPLILIPLWKWGKKFVPVLVTLVFLSIGCVIATFIVEGYTNVSGLGNPLGLLPRTYTKTHTRYSPWLIDFPFDSSVVYAALNESLKRALWAIALAWIVFACHFGYGGLVNSILSHPFWQPIGRLTYSMYLLHMLVQEINYGISKTDAYFSDYTMILEFWKTLGITLLSSIVLSLSFEAPILVLEKAIFGRRKPKSDSTDNIMPSTSQNKIV